MKEKPTWKEQFERMLEERKNPERTRHSNPREAIESLLQLVSETRMPNRIEAEILTEYSRSDPPKGWTSRYDEASHSYIFTKTLET